MTTYEADFSEPDGYMNFASIGPPGRRVAAALAEIVAAVSHPSGDVPPLVMGRYEAALATLGRFVGAAPEQVTVVPSTSAGLFQVAFGLLSAGGNVVVPAHEFPANLYPWLRSAEAGGPEVRRVEVPDGRVTAGVLAAAVDADTRAIAVSLVDYATGFRVDLAALRELAGDALLVVDAIQALGAIRVGLSPADVVVAGGQKWMRAGWGAGLMAVSSRAFDRLAPTLTGWWGVEDAFDFVTPPLHAPRADADRFQEGSPNVFGAVALAAAIDVIEAVGVAAVEAAVLERSGLVAELAAPSGAEVRTPWRHETERAGIVTLRMPGEDAAATVARLAAEGFVVSERSGWVRVSPHASTSIDAVEALAGVLGAVRR